MRDCVGSGVVEDGRVGTGASGGGVVVGLDFEGWEEGGEAVFGYWATGVGWCHF